ncbi:tumor necrosis factor receptor superfamily member 3 isoform X1 [Electrophorus electricus]|uniref:TNFR-Cys domain-containing protein n=1 Tax=Electrophorus electricus TaxID=8005 RepID=A0A4W4EGS3_ELEEL|nr:tumor necrosis factor receptor superfamily member 3 isoform X1 [Electrophorus electricus]
MKGSSCPPDQYEYNGLCCNLCPEGKYVSTYCDNKTVTKCQICPHNTYMKEKNGLHSCLPCTQCDVKSHQRELIACKAHSDRKCTCEVGYYCKYMDHESHESCQHCKQVTTCQPGQGVFAKSTSSTDTECRSCELGTFNSKTDYQTPCYNHTRCEELGRYLVTPGTPSADAVCGELLRPCHWISAGLGVCLVLAVLISIGFLYWVVKRKQKPGSVTVSPYSDNPQVLPPDLIHLQTYTHKDELCTEQDDCRLECDGITMTTMTMSQIDSHSAAREMCGAMSVLHSEPQEDEWPGS